MPWITTKEGKHINTDWFDKDRQIAQNKAEADERKEAPKLKDSKNFNDFIRENRNNPQLRKVLEDGTMEDIKQEWYQLRHDVEAQNLKEVNIEDAIDKITQNIRPSALTGWFRSANSEYKPEIANSVLGNEGVLNAAMNIGYYNYRYQFERYSELYQKWIPHDGVDQSKKLSFKEWLVTPQTMYRGTHGQKVVSSDIFMSYTPDRKTAEKFLNTGSGGTLETVQIRPIDTLGSYQTTGEQEYLVPAKWLKEHKK